MDNIINVSHALQFIYGGNAEFILESKATGNRIIYELKVSNRDKDMFFVRVDSYRTDDSIGMKYAGFIKRHGNKYEFYKGAKGMYNKNHMYIKALMYVTLHLIKHNLTNDVIIRHCGRCGICGRKLTDVKSIERGFGKYCYEHYVLGG